MTTIRVLPIDVANKIAAGEVVERPASVIKELVENAIDAGAKTIKVDSRKGGKQLMRVMDDGRGIVEAELPLAFSRHATSKLTSIEELTRVKTLGFRGEALASVAAVSQLTCVSRPLSQTAATRIRIEGSHQTGLGSAGAPAGTSISVENLFYNVPARLKFLKADATEAGHIYRVVSHYALAYPHVRFSLQTESRTVFQTNGSGKLLDALISVFGLETAREMLPVGEVEQEMGIEHDVDEQGRVNLQSPTVYGYVGTPSLHRGTRNQIVFFVNKRWIQDRSLNQAVIQAYHTFLPVGRFPVAVLNIDLDPALVDVNVHPTKAEVKFQEQRAVFSAVQRAVRAVVTEQAPIASFQTPGADGHGHGEHVGGHGSGGKTPWQPPHFGAENRNRAEMSQFGLEIQRTLDLEGDSGKQELMSLPGDPESRMPMMRVVGQVQQMYIIAEGPDGLYLIDQHAAHERILYEKMTAQKAKAEVIRQQLLEPLILDLSPVHSAIVEAELSALTEVGFEIEPFGGNTYRLRAVPEILGQAEPAKALVDILDEMADGAIPLAKEIHEKIAITVCKRASIKGGQILSPEEMRELVRQLEATTAPRTCPHGRPTMIHLSVNELARQFGRIH
ncbi:DNA mismatch repair endonuclease MutL [Anaerolineales bacterium HSG6]|nr:DNA mismatch repair endonuclease MutL [Anaerolineales bacterium HSG6]MDM8529834.1 DNA mismatch repair endonuclease MutL [Anaerolineales bacterium HSG25]